MMDRAVKILMALLLTSAVVLGGMLAYQRYLAETASRTVELAMDLRDLRTLAALSKYPLDKLLVEVKSLGITSIGLPEETLSEATAAGELLYLSGSGLLRSRELNPILADVSRRKLVKPANSYVLGFNPEVRKRVQKQLHYVLPQKAFKNLGEKVFELNESERLLKEVGIGFSESTVRYLTKKGFSIIPRLTNDPRYDVPGKISELVGYRTVIFDGEEIMGYPDRIDFLALAMKKSRVKYGYVEIIKQEGDQKLKAKMGDQVVRVHSVPKDELLKIDKDEAVIRFARAVKERGIRLIYIRPFLPPQINEDPVKYNLGYLNEISEKLKRAGYELGSASTLKMVKPEGWQVIMLGLGTLIIALLLIDSFVAIPWYAFFLILLAGIFGMVYVGAGSRGYPLEKGLAFLAACTVPAYAVISQLRAKNPIYDSGPLIVSAVYILLNVMAECFLGVFLVIGLLANTDFMLGSQNFFGVKAALVLPMIITILYFLPRSREKYLDLLNQNIKVLYILTGAVLLAGAFVMLARSGNFVLPVMGIEKYFRQALEAILSVRPRTKEFLIGYPALVLAILLFLKDRRNWLWLLAGVGVIGPISVLNSFCHAHTALVISFSRTLIGLVLGIAVSGVVGLLYLNLSARSEK